MLNETRVKHMVQLAMYENKDSADEFKASSFYKKDYISFNMLWSIIWMTIAYIIVAILFVLAKLDYILEVMSMQLLITWTGYAIGAYLLLVILYISLSRRFYRKKHAKAYHRVNRFKEGLEMLEEMYQEEESNG